MKFARIVFGLAAVYGILSLLPLYFLLDKVGRDAPLRSRTRSSTMASWV
jgi:hypothetical protein